MNNPEAHPILSFINPPGLYDPRGNGYSHVVTASASAPIRLVQVAGQGGERTDGQLAVGFEAQVNQALDNLQVALRAARATLADVIKLSVLIVDHTEARLAVLSSALLRLWGDRPTPACTLIPVPRLALDGMLFEVEALAVVSACTQAQS